MRKRKEEKTFHYSELQAYFGRIHESEFSTRETPRSETETMGRKMEQARHKQHAVKVNGKIYKSVAASFLALDLPMHKHQAFRKKLKIEKKAEFDGHKFEIATFSSLP